MSKYWTPINFAALNAVCMSRFESLLSTWLPDGKIQCREWVALNPTRADNRRGSFRINVDTGRWADFATDAKGGDPISLYAYVNGLSQSRAALELKKQFGMGV
jgi:hypothetical protein